VHLRPRDYGRILLKVNLPHLAHRAIAMPPMKTATRALKGKPGDDD